MLNHISNTFEQPSDKYIKELQGEFDRNGYVFQNPGSTYFSIQQKTHSQSPLSCRFTKKPDLPDTYDMILDKGSDNDINNTIQNIFNRFYCVNRLINIINAVSPRSLTYSYDDDKNYNLYIWAINGDHKQTEMYVMTSKKIITSIAATLCIGNRNNSNNDIVQCKREILNQLDNIIDIGINNHDYIKEDNILLINIFKIDEMT